MLIVNTRPQSRGQALSTALTSDGWQVIDLPLLRLVPTQLGNFINQIRELPKVQCIVVVSPTAAELGMQALKDSGMTLAELGNIEWIAVGQGTADCLRQWKIVAHVPEVETSEGMLQLPYLEHLSQAAAIAFWRGEGGRTFMMEQLIEKGHTVLNIVLYTRELPINSAERFLGVVQQRPDVVLISSEASWRYWKKLILRFDVADHLQNTHYIVLGTRLNQCLAVDIPSQRLHQIHRLHLSELRSCLKDIETHNHE